MAENSSKLIISQRYLQKDSDKKATLVDLCGDRALVQTEDALVNMTIEKFKTLFSLILPL